MATVFVRDALAAERQRLMSLGDSVSSASLIEAIVDSEDAVEAEDALASDGIAFLPEGFAMALNGGDRLAAALAAAQESARLGYQLQAGVTEALLDYVPYLIVACGLIQIHYSRAKGVTLDIPNPGLPESSKKS